MLRKSYLRHRHSGRNLQEWARIEDLLFVVSQGNRDLGVQKLKIVLVMVEKYFTFVFIDVTTSLDQGSV